MLPPCSHFIVSIQFYYFPLFLFYNIPFRTVSTILVRGLRLKCLWCCVLRSGDCASCYSVHCYLVRQFQFEITPLLINLTWQTISAILRFYVEGMPKIFDFGYFVLIWRQTDNKTLKKSWNRVKDLFIWTELPIVWLIIRFVNIFNIEVNAA